MANRKGSKKKGNRYENAIAKIIRAHLIPEGIDPKIAYNLLHRTGMSGARTERGDMIIQPPLLEYFPYFFECRDRESWNFYQVTKNPTGCLLVRWYWQDAVAKCHSFAGKHHRFPMLVFTRHQCPNYFMMLLGHADEKHLDALSWSTYIPVDSGVLVIGLFEEFLEAHEPPPTSIFDGLDFK